MHLHPKITISALCVAAFFVAVFILHTTPIEDGDFFWHLSSGKWIWEHKDLPTADPFSFTAYDINPYRPESRRIPFLLRQYWMGQLALYGIWKVGGSAGIVLLRAFTYTGILAFLYSWMRRYAAGIMPLVFVFLAGNHLVEHPSERPQLFTFLFMPILLYLLDSIRKKENVLSCKASILLPLLMIVWANTHGGYLLGVGLILICLFSHLADSFLGRTRINARLVSLLLFSAGISIINPNGFLTLEYFSTASYYFDTILENLSPVTAAVQDHKIMTYYWIYFLIAVVTVIARFRKMETFHVAIIIALGIFSLTGIRHIPFFLFASPLLIGYVSEPRGKDFKWAAAALALAVWIFSTDWSSRLKFGSDTSFPKDAVRFMQATHPPPRIFNFYDWGGYLMYYLPDYKVFIDGRGLIEETTLIFEKILFTDEWKRLLDFYGINTVLMPSTGDVYPLVTRLITDSDWNILYRDDTAAIFVRKIPISAMPGSPKL